MAFIFWRNALKLSAEGTHLNFPLVCTLKCHPRKSNPSVVAVSFVFFWLTFIPPRARNWLMWSSIAFASSSGLSIITISSAYRTDGCIFSIPLSALLANSGLMTPPWGVPCSGNSQVDSGFKRSEDSCLDALWGYESFHDGCVIYPIETFVG